jgi:hypothetical protein
MFHVQDSKKMSWVCVSNFWEKDQNVNTKIIFIEWQILNIVVSANISSTSF